jgi:S-layer homology domain.
MKRVTVDVNFEDADEDYIKIAFALGSINGVSETKFAPNAFITRQEAAKMLANTMQIQAAFAYVSNKEMGYKDFDQISDWAKPAVQVVHSATVMRGVGDRFDYNGKFTREQAISTLYRMLDQGIIDYPALRGVIITDSPYDELTYYVSRNEIRVDFDETKTGTNSIVKWVVSDWRTFDVTNKTPFDSRLAVAVYGFARNLKPRDFDVAISGTVKGKSTKIDYGYMTVTTLDGDHLLSFKLKDVPGYATIIGGYYYGYPQKEVTAKVIK